MKKQTDGRYRAKVTVGHAADGKAIYKYASGKTKRELEENKQELIKAYVTGNAGEMREITFGSYALSWYDKYKRDNVGVGSAQNYASTFNAHLLPAFGDKRIRAITVDDIQMFLRDRNYLSASHMSKLHMTLDQIFRVAFASGVIDRNPMDAVIIPRCKSGSRRALTDAESLAVLRVAPEHEYGLLLWLLYYSGLRIGEALGLQWQDIDFAKNEISVERDIDYHAGDVGDPKSAASYRHVPLFTPLSRILYPLRSVGQRFIISSPRTQSYLSQPTSKRHWLLLMEAVYNADPSIEWRDANDARRAKLPPDKAAALPERRVSILTAHYFRHPYVKYTTKKYRSFYRFHADRLSMFQADQTMASKKSFTL